MSKTLAQFNNLARKAVDIFLVSAVISLLILLCFTSPGIGITTSIIILATEVSSL